MADSRCRESRDVRVTGRRAYPEVGARLRVGRPRVQVVDGANDGDGKGGIKFIEVGVGEGTVVARGEDIEHPFTAVATFDTPPNCRRPGRRHGG